MYRIAKYISTKYNYEPNRFDSGAQSMLVTSLSCLNDNIGINKLLIKFKISSLSNTYFC